MNEKKKSVEDFWKKNRSLFVTLFIIYIFFLLSLSVFGIIFTLARRYDISDIGFIVNLVVYTGNALLMGILLFAIFRFKNKSV
jgi:hypothetical protein